MRTPSNLALAAARDRAAAGRLYSIRAAVSSPGARPVSPARRALDEQAAKIARRRREAARRPASPLTGFTPPAAKLRFRASAVTPEMMRKMREDSGRAAGEDPPLSVAERERLARALSRRRGITIDEARRAVAGGAR